MPVSQQKMVLMSRSQVGLAYLSSNIEIPLANIFAVFKKPQ